MFKVVKTTWRDRILNLGSLLQIWKSHCSLPITKRVGRLRSIFGHLKGIQPIQSAGQEFLPGIRKKKTHTGSHSEAAIANNKKTTGITAINSTSPGQKNLRYQVADGRALFAAARGKEFLMAKKWQTAARQVSEFRYPDSCIQEFFTTWMFWRANF